MEYQRTRDPRLRESLVEAHANLAYAVARRFSGRGEEPEDLRQVALLALVQAVDRFDPSRGLAFSTFATPTIAGTLKRHFRDRTWAVRPPRPVQERYLEVAALGEELTHQLGRVPTVAELAGHGKWSEDEVHQALDAAYMHRRHEPWPTHTEQGQREVGTVDADLDRVESRNILEQLLESLPEREREIVELRFFGELPQAAIGRKVRLSQMHVSRLLAQSLARLRVAAFEHAPSPA
jgi:RNA polymerase sigma-B factor